MNAHEEEVVLAERLAAGPPQCEEALSQAIGLACAIRKMHQSGEILGSLGPECIAISPHGVRIDRDCLKAARDMTAYTSPEQLDGEEPDARSDVFVFGTVFYEMLAGRPAFAGGHPDDVRKQVLESQPAPLEDVPDDLRRVLLRCLEKFPERRWQRISAVIIELKLVHAAARQARQAADWKEKMAGLRAQLAGVDGRLSASQTVQESVIAELREKVRRMEEEHSTQSALVQMELAGLQKGAQFQARAIESLESAIAQTDEVVEHVVDAFGMTQKPLVERAQAVLVSRNGN